MKNMNMNMEVEIITKEFIMPSSPTPNHLKTFNISLLDQLGSERYISMLLFYPASATVDITTVLKQSVSRTLSLYYPLAGRRNTSHSIHCNDDGVYYVCASVNVNLSHYLKTPPNYSNFTLFMPDENVCGDLKSGGVLVTIQETSFSCGGIVVGVNVSHMVFDAMGFCAFIKTWAAISRDDPDTTFPDFTSSALFPQGELGNEIGFMTAMNIKTSSLPTVTRRFLFDGSVMNDLKSESESSSIPNPTRVEAVFAVLIRSIRAAIKAYSKEKPFVLALSTVNMRRRVVPPVRESSIGNFIWVTPFLLDNIDDETDLPYFVIRMRNAVMTIDDDFVRCFQGEKGVEGIKEALQQLGQSSCSSRSYSVQIPITSWLNSGLYKCADFGWGRPLWIPFAAASIPRQFPLIQLMDARDENGIEAWVMLEENTMNLVENDKQLLSFAALDPSPLLAE